MSAIKTALSVGILLVSLAVLVNVLLGGRRAPTPEAFVGTPDLEAAIAEARASDRVVFAVATADWCPPCQRYKREALRDARVASWIGKHAVPVYIDVTDGATDAARRLGVRGVPASFVIDGDGEVIARTEGVRPGEALVEWLERAVSVETAGAGR